ncbi:MAG: FMN-binding protein [Sedimentisphaerales bacterium]|nr:FMN-binding protein [Sedimentisphaerales bacterium]
MQDKIKYFLKQSWLLIAASFFFGLLIAVTNASLKERIDYNLNVYKYNKAAKVVLPEADNFEEVAESVSVKTNSGKELTTSVKKAVDSDGNALGWAFICEGKGFADKVQLLVIVDNDFERMIGYGVLYSIETVKYGDEIRFPEFMNQFKGAPAGGFQLSKTGDKTIIDSEIVAITGATITSQAVVDMFNAFIPQVKEQMQEKGLI